MAATEPYDAAVIGGGIMGCATALHLARHHMRVVVFDRRGLCMEASGNNAGSLSPMIKRTALVPYAVKGYAIWRRSRQLLGTDIAVHVKPGIIAAFSEPEAAELAATMGERRAAGAPVELIGANRAREIEPALSDRVVLAAHCPMDGHADSTRTGMVYRHALTGAGVDLREGAAVSAVVAGGTGFVVRAGETSTAARRIVLAGGAWLGEMAGWLGFPLRMKYRINQMAVTERMPPIVRTVIGVPNGLLTLKQVANGSVVLGGGWQGKGDLAYGGVEIVPENLIGNLRMAKYVIPAIGGTRVVRSWLGLEARIADYMPVVGAIPGVGDAFIIGCCRGGFAIGPYLGELLGELILGREPEMPLFDPARLLGDQPAAPSRPPPDRRRAVRPIP